VQPRTHRLRYKGARPTNTRLRIGPEFVCIQFTVTPEPNRIKTQPESPIFFSRSWKHRSLWHRIFPNLGQEKTHVSISPTTRGPGNGGELSEVARLADPFDLDRLEDDVREDTEKASKAQRPDPDRAVMEASRYRSSYENRWVPTRSFL
jgi:hypothetical protein